MNIELFVLAVLLVVITMLLCSVWMVLLDDRKARDKAEARVTELERELAARKKDGGEG